MRMLAIIETGGKQYVVREGEELRVEKLEVQEGEKVTFDKVLLSGEGEKVALDEKTLSGKTVTATVTSQGRDKKVWGMKHKAKKRYKMKFGHKQPHTMVKIEKIA